jgi:hypothetical protein
VGCSIQGKLIRSQGEIPAWNTSGYINKNSNFEFIFNVNNSHYKELRENIVGVTTDKNPTINKNHQNEFMIIEFRFKAHNSEYYLSPKAVLDLGGDQHIPMKVAVGKYSYQKGCIVERRLDFKIFEIKEVTDKYDFHCIKFEYNLKPPKPEQTFKLYLQTSHNDKVSEVIVKFSPVIENINYN